MSLGSMAAFACGVSSVKPAFYDIQTLQQIFSLGNCEGYGQALTLKDSEPYPNIEDQFIAQFSMPFTREFGSTTEHYTVQMDLLNFPLKIILNTVLNCSENLPSSLYVNNRKTSKEDFISQYGNKLILDIANLPGQLTTRNLNTICILGQNGLASPNLPITLRFDLHGLKGYCPLSMGLKTSNYYCEDMRTFGGKTELWYAARTDCLDLYLAYLNHSLSITTWNDAKKYGNTDYVKKVAFDNYQYSFLFDKEIIDAIIQDLNTAGIDIDYYEASLSPLTLPRIQSLHCPDGIISPAFDSEIGSYTLSTTRQSLFMRWMGNEFSDFVGYKLDEGDIVWSAATHLQNPVMEHTFNMSLGSHTIKLYARQGESSQAVEYEFSVSVRNPESGDSGSGGTGNNESQQITNQNSFNIGNFFNCSYMMNIDAISRVGVEIWNPDFLSMITSLTTNAQGAIINCFCFPFNVNSLINTNEDVVNVYLGNYHYSTSSNEKVKKVSHGSEVPSLTFTSSQEIPSFFGSFLDENPYTTCMIYLPFLGYQEINPDFIYNKILNVKYIIDITTGTAKIQLWSKKAGEIDFLINEFTTKIGTEICLNSTNFGQVKIQALLAGLDIVKNAQSISQAVGEGAEKALSMVGSVSVSSRASQDSCDRVSPLDCFVLFIRNQPAVPENYDSRFGRPSMKKAVISKCSGFTSFINPQFETRATDSEKQELISLLENGIIIK